MAAPPDPQEELLPLAGPGSQWLGDRREGEDEAATLKGAKPAPQAGESARGLGAGPGEAAPRDPGSSPARPPPVAMETASTGKAGGRAGAAAPQPRKWRRGPGSPRRPGSPQLASAPPSRALPGTPVSPPPPRSPRFATGDCKCFRTGRKPEFYFSKDSEGNKIPLVVLFNGHSYFGFRSGPRRRAQRPGAGAPAHKFLPPAEGLGAPGARAVARIRGRVCAQRARRRRGRGPQSGGRAGGPPNPALPGAGMSL